MVPIKFEDNIREKLQEREITPSNKSWEELAKQLETSKSIKPFWFAIAAGFIGIIIVTSFILNKEIIPTKITTEIVKEINQKDTENPVENNKNIVISNENSSEEKDAELLINKNTKNNPSKKGNTIAVGIKKQSSSEKSESNKDAVAKLETQDPEPNLEVDKNEVFINSKIEEVVAHVQALQKSDNMVSVKEINSLLLKAQGEINSRKILNNNNKKVDATALLNMVETELETSFRDKVFEALGDGFEKVRTAVVERDN